MKAKIVIGVIAAILSLGLKADILKDISAIPWTTANQVKLNQLVNSRASATALMVALNPIDIDGKPMRPLPDVCEYKWVDLAGNGTLSLLTTVNRWSVAGCSQLYVISKTSSNSVGTSQIVDDTPIAELNARVVKLDSSNPNKIQVLVPHYLSPILNKGMPVAVINDVYVWNGTQLVANNKAFKQYYKSAVAATQTVLDQQQQDTTEDQTIRALNIKKLQTEITAMNAIINQP